MQRLTEGFSINLSANTRLIRIMNVSLVLAKGVSFVLTAGVSSYACCFCREVYTPASELCATVVCREVWFSAYSSGKRKK